MLIARAVYKNPEFLFFDEATNALDANNEKEIMEHLHEFYKGKTVVVAGNFQDSPQQLTVKLGEKWLNVTLQAHSFNTFEFQVK